MGNSPEFSHHEEDIREIQQYIFGNSEFHALAFQIYMQDDPYHWQLIKLITEQTEMDDIVANQVLHTHFLLELTELKQKDPEKYSAFIGKVTLKHIEKFADEPPTEPAFPEIDQSKQREIDELNTAFGPVSPETASLLAEWRTS